MLYDLIFQFINVSIFEPKQILPFKSITQKFTGLNSLFVGIKIVEKLNFSHKNHNLTQLYSQSLIPKLNYPIN